MSWNMYKKQKAPTPPEIATKGPLSRIPSGRLALIMTANVPMSGAEVRSTMASAPLAGYVSYEVRRRSWMLVENQADYVVIKGKFQRLREIA